MKSPRTLHNCIHPATTTIPSPKHIPKKNYKKIPKHLVISIKLPIFASQFRKGAIAQLVEQRTENPCVPGSIPGGTTSKIAKCLNYRYLAISHSVAILQSHYKSHYRTRV